LPVFLRDQKVGGSEGSSARVLDMPSRYLVFCSFQESSWLSACPLRDYFLITLSRVGIKVAWEEAAVLHGGRVVDHTVEVAGVLVDLAEDRQAAAGQVGGGSQSQTCQNGKNST
jgi:hypothetical protein